MTVQAIVTAPQPSEPQEGTVPPQDGAYGEAIQLRQQIVEEARSWIRTPYHRRAWIKGVGADCGTLPYAVCRKFNLIPEIAELPVLEDGWFANTTDQRYARIVERYFRRLVESQSRRDLQPEFLPGNIVLVQSWGSRVYNHAGIITSWPRVVNALPDYGVAEVDASTDQFWALQKIAVYDVLSGGGK